MIEKSKSIPLTNKEYELYLNPANYHICNKNWHKYPADENYSRVREHCCSKGKNRGTLLMRITVELENIAVLKEKTEVLNLVYVI